MNIMKYITLRAYSIFVTWNAHVGREWTKKPTTYYYNNILDDNNRKNTINNTIFYIIQTTNYLCILLSLIIKRETADIYPKRVRYSKLFPYLKRSVVRYRNKYARYKFFIGLPTW